MMEKGVNLKVMQDTLGHSDIRVTLEIYTEAQKDFRKDELSKLSDL
jgi:site-specific recombinase XerD